TASDGCETNTQSDTFNCGGCGTTCARSNATAVCSAGSCALGTCSSGFGNCDGVDSNGCETNLRTDLNHCGTCTSRCVAGAHVAVTTCSAGACTYACAMGYGDCDHNPLNGCETDLTSDVSNCGGCGHACGAVRNGTAACFSGTCGIG